MQAVDTNVLVYSEAHASPRHGTAKSILRTLAEGPVPWAIPWPCVSEFAEVLIQVIEQSGATGNLVHDAHIAALCLEHGITELITADRDFARFPGLRVRNPFAGR
jgi:predicted nucleic acid-binding protein